MSEGEKEDVVSDLEARLRELLAVPFAPDSQWESEAREVMERALRCIGGDGLRLVADLADETTALLRRLSELEQENAALRIALDRVPLGVRAALAMDSRAALSEAGGTDG